MLRESGACRTPLHIDSTPVVSEYWSPGQAGRRQRGVRLDQLRYNFQTADTPSPSRGSYRPSFASQRALIETRAQGRPGTGWHPRSVRQKMHTGWTTGVAGSPGLPCANGFNGVLRALLGERCTIAPVVLRMADVRVRSDRHITAGLDAQTPGVGTTRLLRPRTSSLGIRGVACARPRSHAKTLSASCRSRERHCSRCPALQCRSRPTPSRPSLPSPRFVTIAIRPLSRARVFGVYDKSEFR